MPGDALSQRLAALDWPRALLDNPPPAPGQIWRAAWQEVACLVVVVEAPAVRSLSVVAAAPEPPGDDFSVVGTTVEAMAPVVWSSLVADLKLFTLEHRLADLTLEAFAAVKSGVTGKRQGQWAPIKDPLDDRSLLRADLLDRMEKLSHAEWVPVSHHSQSLAYLASGGVTASGLATDLGVTPGSARRLLQGQRGPTFEEQKILTGKYNVFVSGASYDLDLVVAMDRPQIRTQLERHLAARSFDDPVAGRRAVAEHILATAARQRRPGARDWDALLLEELREG